MTNLGLFPPSVSRQSNDFLSNTDIIQFVRKQYAQICKMTVTTCAAQMICTVDKFSQNGTDVMQVLLLNSSGDNPIQTRHQAAKRQKEVKTGESERIQRWREMWSKTRSDSQVTQSE